MRDGTRCYLCGGEVPQHCAVEVLDNTGEGVEWAHEKCADDAEGASAEEFHGWYGIGVF